VKEFIIVVSVYKLLADVLDFAWHEYLVSPGISYFNYFPTTEKSVFWTNGRIQ